MFTEKCRIFKERMGDRLISVDQLPNWTDVDGQEYEVFQNVYRTKKGGVAYATVRQPILTEEERNRRMELIREALADLGRAVMDNERKKQMEEKNK